MIFRATQKVSSKLRIARTVITHGDLSMVEWYCNLIIVRRRQFFLFTHAPSLFSFWALPLVRLATTSARCSADARPTH